MQWVSRILPVPGCPSNSALPPLGARRRLRSFVWRRRSSCCRRSPAPRRSGRVSRRTARALVALYRATNGASWIDSSNWVTAAPLHEWFGVRTDDGGRVTALLLDDNGLTGPIPPASGDLARLETLSLSQNALTGPFRPSWAAWRTSMGWTSRRTP